MSCSQIACEMCGLACSASINIGRTRSMLPSCTCAHCTLQLHDGWRFEIAHVCASCGVEGNARASERESQGRFAAQVRMSPTRRPHQSKPLLFRRTRVLFVESLHARNHIKEGLRDAQAVSRYSAAVHAISSATGLGGVCAFADSKVLRGGRFRIGAKGRGSFFVRVVVILESSRARRASYCTQVGAPLPPSWQQQQRKALFL